MHPFVNDVNGGCLAMGGGITEKIFRVPGIEPTTPVTPVRSSDH